MDISPELDEYIHESIQHFLGLPVSNKTLEAKLIASEQSRRDLHAHVLSLQDLLKQRDEKIERCRAEASMNAQALKKYIEENQRLVADCSNMTNQCSRLERECCLYDRDREALMEFGNDADERAKEAEIRALEAEESSKRLLEEVENYKREREIYLTNNAKITEELLESRKRIKELESTRSRSGFEGCDTNLSCSKCSLLMADNRELRSLLKGASPVDSSGDGAFLEVQLLDSVITLLLARDEAGKVTGESTTIAHSFLEAYREVESCQRLLELWERLKPPTRNIIELAAQVELLQKAKEHLRINLHRAEEEVKILFDENSILDEENKRLLRQCNRDRQHGSGGSQSAKSKKRAATSPKLNNSVEKMAIDSNGSDSPRQPLSPLQHNSSPGTSRLHNIRKARNEQQLVPS